MAENRIRFSAEAESRGFDKVKQDLNEARDGVRDLNAVIGQGSGVQAELGEQTNQAARVSSDAIRQLETSTESLNAAFAKLPEMVRSSLSEVMSNLRSANFVEALQASATVPGVPPEVRQQIVTVAARGLEAAQFAPTAAVSRALSDTLLGVDTAPTTAHSGTRRATLADEATPTPHLRSAFEALKAGDLDKAREQQRQGARSAMRGGDQEGFETATQLTRAFREYDERDNGVESAKRYQATIERLEGRLEAAEADTSQGGARSLNPKVAMGRAQRGLSTVDATLSGLTPENIRAADLTTLERGLGRAGSYVQQAERGGAEGRELDDLKDQLRELTEALGKTREAYQQRQEGGGGAEPRQPDQPQPDNPGGAILDELKRFAGAGMGGGVLGRTLTRLGPYGVAAGAALAANNFAERFVAGPSKQARETYTTTTDLARLYGYDSADGQDPLEMFRSRESGLSHDELVDMGYTARDAERVMATLDTPAAGRADLPVEDTRDILQFSRSNGLSETQVAGAVQSLRESGVYEVGGAQEPLEVIKMALTDAVKNGVSQADALQTLVNLTAQGLQEGRSGSLEALAMQASLANTLGGMGEATLRGTAGADAQQSLNGMVTGGGDPAMMMLLAPAIEGITTEELGLSGAAAEGYEQLQQFSPMAASFEALDLLADGRNPEALADLAQRLEDATGGNLDLMNTFLINAGLNTEQRMAVLGEGVGDIYAEAAEGSADYLAGEDLEADVQGGNVLDANSRKLQASERDEQETTGWGRLALFGDAGELASRAKRKSSQAGRNILTAVGGNDNVNQPNLEEQGNLRTPGMVAPEQPSSAPGQPSGSPTDDSSAQRDADIAQQMRGGGKDAFTNAARAHAGPRQPNETPTDEVVNAVQESLELLNATAVTTQPGQIYGESLRGTDAEFLIGSQHRGVDLRIGAQGRSDPVTSPWEGAEIIAADHSETLGNWMVLESPNGEQWQFGHLDDASGEDRIGETLGRGDVIGMEGNSGASTGYHLDMRLLEMNDEDKRINADPAAFYEHYLNSVSSTSPEASAGGGEVHVFHHGLENIQVEGLAPAAKQQAEASLRGFAAAVREPSNHRGAG